MVQAMGLARICKSIASNLCKDVNERLNEFLNRPLTDASPYGWRDAPCPKVRRGGQSVPVAAMIAVAANIEGHGKREPPIRHG